MLTDLGIADLLLAQYQNGAAQHVSGVDFTVQDMGDCTVVAFEGSHTPLDWHRDFEAVMVNDVDLGAVENGFLQGMRDVQDEIDLPPDSPLIIIGHSLGAARAAIFAGLTFDQGMMVPGDRIVLFGCPRPGGENLKSILARIPITSYRNGKDPVCDVPFDIPLIEPYCHVRDFTMLNATPADDDIWNIVPDMGWHHIQNYRKGLEALHA